MRDSILFLEDWLKYPRAIADFDTKNKSCLSLAAKLKYQGIKNHFFFLALHDPTLQGVDPHDIDNLTEEQMIRIGIECKVNMWYFLREVARAPAVAGVSTNFVEFNRANVSLWWSFANHITYILTQPRQTGKSFSTDCLMTGLMNFWTNNTQINLLTKDDKLRSDNIKRLKDIYDELPAYLKYKSKEDTNNTEEITIKKFGNTYRTHVPQSSEKNARKVGRGMTTPIFQVDEAPFQPWIEVAVASAFGAMGAAIEQAKENGEPYGVIFTTTAGKRDDRDGKWVYNYISKAAPWSDRYYDAVNHSELERMVIGAGRSGDMRVYGTFNHLQVGKSNEWLKGQLLKSDIAPDEANRDYFNVWTAGTATSPLHVSVLERLTKNIREEDCQLIAPISNYLVRWYIDEKQINAYMADNETVAGLDASDASGGDDMSFVICNPLTGQVLAVSTVNMDNLTTYSHWLLNMMITYPKMILVPERRSSAVAIIDFLLSALPSKGIDPFRRIFNWVVNDPLEHRALWDDVRQPLWSRPRDIYVRAKKTFGFATSGSGETARSELYSTILQSAARRFAEVVYDRQLVEQITGLENRNGRVDHPVGGHDDLVVAWLMTQWFLTRAKNLNYYGLDASKVLKVASNVRDTETPTTYEQREQQRIRTRIQELMHKLSQENDPNIYELHERELKYLSSQLILGEDEYFSLDHALKHIEDSRVQNGFAKSLTNVPKIHETPFSGISHLYSNSSDGFSYSKSPWH